MKKLYSNTYFILSILFIFVFGLVGFIPVNVEALSNAAPAVPTISHNQYEGDTDGNFDIKVDMWYGNNATSYKLYERLGTEGGYKILKSGNLVDNSPSPQNFTINITDKNKDGDGTYYYYVEFINSFGKSQSNTISVKVGESSSGGGAATGVPGKPSIQADQFGEDLDGDYTIEVNLWSGNNATSYKVYERIGHLGDFSVVKEGSLLDGTPSRQQEFIKLTGRTIPATYYYYVEMINKFGSTNSNTITIKVGVNDESNIIIKGIDDQVQKMQGTIPQGVSEFDLINIGSSNPNYTVKLSNPTVVKASINGSKLRLEGLQSGRSGLQIIDNSSGDIRKIGIKVKNTNGTNPGMPNYLSIGSVSEDMPADLDFWGDIDTDDTNKRMDVRYIYINGGPLEEGWVNWTTNPGDRVKKFLRESLKMGAIPFFVFYNIPAGGESYVTDLENIQTESYMEAYYKNLKFFIDLCNEWGEDELVGMIFEPDFLGYMMQNSGKRPGQIEAMVHTAYTSGILDKDVDPIFEDNITGLVESINYIVDKYKPDAYNGWQYNTWAYAATGVPEIGLMHATERMGIEKGQAFIKNAAVETSKYYLEAGINSYNTEFISVDKYGLDGAYERAGQPNSAANDPEKSMWFWNSELWNNYLLYVKQLGETAKRPVILWQLPVGRINSSLEPNPYNGGSFPDLNNTDMKFEDSSSAFFFGDTFTPGTSIRYNYFAKNSVNDPKVSSNGQTVTWGSHMEETRDAGVISMLFGAGVGMSTDAVGSPPTENYWWITKVQRYFKNPVPLNNVEEPVIGDVNGDKLVNITDLSLVAQSYNAKVSTPLYDIKKDLNKDGIIDLFDLTFVASRMK